MEIMIVIALIGIIGSIIGFSMRGSLDEGKAFKTEQAVRKLEDIIELELAKGKTWEQFQEDKKVFIEKTGLVKKTKDVLTDGWGNEFHIDYENGVLKISSDKWEAYKLEKGISEDKD